jgi:hypothetical protein
MISRALSAALVLASASAALFPGAGCESCEFSAGAAFVEVSVISDVPAIGLKVVICDQTDDPSVDAGQCRDALPCAPDGAGTCRDPGPQTFSLDIAYTGTFGCSAGPYVVRVTADNCDPETIVRPEGEQYTSVDVELDCS